MNPLSIEWTLQAHCRGMEDALFPEGKDQKRARAVCQHCPVKMRCLVEALDTQVQWGVWGGMTERERRQVLRQNPDVVSWRQLFVEGKLEETLKKPATETSDGDVVPAIPRKATPRQSMSERFHDDQQVRTDETRVEREQVQHESIESVE